MPQLLSPQHWIPFDVDCSASDPQVHWLYRPGLNFKDFSFQQTVSNAFKDPFRTFSCRQTSLRDLLDGADQLPDPAGFIFHISRCGSSLASRLLSHHGGVESYCEPGFLDGLLRIPSLSPLKHDVSPELIRASVRRLFSSTPGFQYVVKLDAWHMLEFPRIQQAFPNIPWIFIHRHPIEVLASQARQPALWTVPLVLDPQLLGLDQQSVFEIGNINYLARLLAGILANAASYAKSHRGLLISHDSLLPSMESRIPQHFGIPISPTALDNMRSAFQAHTKSQDLEFMPDSAVHHAPASSVVQRAYEEHLRANYEQILTVG